MYRECKLVYKKFSYEKQMHVFANNRSLVVIPRSKVNVETISVLFFVLRFLIFNNKMHSVWVCQSYVYVLHVNKQVQFRGIPRSFFNMTYGFIQLRFFVKKIRCFVDMCLNCLFDISFSSTCV